MLKKNYDKGLLKDKKKKNKKLRIHIRCIQTRMF